MREKREREEGESERERKSSMKNRKCEFLSLVDIWSLGVTLLGFFGGNPMLREPRPKNIGELMERILTITGTPASYALSLISSLIISYSFGHYFEPTTLQNSSKHGEPPKTQRNEITEGHLSTTSIHF